jgi:hypothetical protein
MKYVRAIAGVVGGLLFALLMVQAAEAFVHRTYPPAKPIATIDDAKAYVAKLPVGGLVMVLAGWMFGTLGGTSIAARIGRSVIPAYVLGGFLLVAGIMNAKTFPQPAWFSVTSWLIFVVMTYVGAKLGTARLTADAPPPAA